jgi:hypothetical protein
MSEVYIPQVGGEEDNSTHFRHQEKPPRQVSDKRLQLETFQTSIMTNSLFRNILRLVLLVPACHALDIDFRTNQAIGTYLVEDQGNGVFNLGIDTAGQDEFDFRIEISTTDAEDAGLWGLSQELSVSTRLACYQNGECITAQPNHEAPILDGDADTIPFYSTLTSATIAADGQSTELRLVDGPSLFVVDSLFLDANGANTSPLTSISVSEEFTVTLLKQHCCGNDGLEIAHQCKWSYTYDFSPEDLQGGLQDGHTFRPTVQNCVAVTGERAIPIIAGPVAGPVGAHRDYTTDNSKQFNDPRFDVFGSGTDTWKM